jgi:arylsulfatase A-like enzyme
VIVAAAALLAAMALIGALTHAAPAAGAGPGAPNILFIVADDQPNGTLYPTIMPNTIQRFKQEGRDFPQAFVTTPLCCPSRSTIFTGRYAHGTEVLTNLDGHKLDQTTTLPHYLHGDGYRTGMFGKYLNDWVALSLGAPPDFSKQPENPPDFDQWAIFDNGAYYPTNNPPQCPNPNIQEGVDCVNEQGVLKRLSVGTYATTYVAGKAEQFLTDAETLNDAQPWFLYIAPTAPHAGTGGTYDQNRVVETQYQGSGAVVPPFVPGDGYNESDLSDKPPYVQNTDAAGNRAVSPGQRDSQLRMLKSVDDLVQRVFSKMDLYSETANTIAIYISDNGYLLGEHGLLRKGQPYNETISVPMMMRYPPSVAAGGTDSRIATNADLAPTALAAAGITPPASAPPIDGRSLLDPTWNRDRLFTEAWRPCTETFRPPICSTPDLFPAWASLRTPAYHYIRYYDDPGSPANEDFQERYELSGDASELTNQYGGNGTRDPGEPQPPASQLDSDRRCSGHGPAGLEPPPCP